MPSRTPEDDRLISYEELILGEETMAADAMIDQPSPAELVVIRAEVRTQIERAVAARSAGGGSGGTEAEEEFPRQNLIKQAKTGLYHTKLIYSHPNSMPFGKAKRLTASIASHSLQDAWTRVAQSYGIGKVASVAVSTRVTAELQGEENLVTIQSLGPADKAVTGISNATWSWYVTPKTMEPFDLTLTLYNTVVVEGEATKIDGPIFTDTFTVEATNWEWAMFQAEQLKPTYLLLAGTLTTMLGVGAWWRGRQKSSAKPKPAKRPTRRRG